MTELTIKKRNPFLAGLLAFLAYPLGHIYVGQIKRGIALIGIFLLIITLVTFFRLLQSYHGMLAVIVIYFGYLVFTIVDAVRLSKRDSNYVLKFYNRWYVYIAYYVLTALVQSAILENRGLLLGYESYRIPSTSMEPTLQRGDFLIADTWNIAVERGDVMIFRYPNDPAIDYIFRVVGLPGETVEYRNKTVFINNQEIRQTESGAYQSFAYPEAAFERRTESLENGEHDILIRSEQPAINGQFEVPAGHYFVMGDNRDNSNDSRYWGYLPQENIKAKANYIWMNYTVGMASGGID